LAAESRIQALDHPDTVVKLSLDENSRDMMVSALLQVQGSIRAVVYKFNDPKMMEILQGALDRGIKVQVLCDEKQSKKNGSLFSALATSGAEIRTWPKKQGKLHAKFVICDQVRVLTGSWNWTRSAGEKNLELLLDMKENATVTRFEELFVQLWEMGQPLAE